MSGFVVVEQYPQSPEQVWRALTDPEVIVRWTTTGQGGTPVGFAPVVGTHFQYVARPLPGWSGVVDCEVLEARAPALLRYSWHGADDAKDDVTVVTCLLEPVDGGTRFRWEHTGFTGLGGFLMCKLLASVRRKMLAVGLRQVLAQPS
jgi:uncharacterized protein YndB with AHSA1/START domain